MFSFGGMAWDKEWKLYEEASSSDDDDSEQGLGSILWGDGRIRSIPQGTYTVLETLTRAYLLQRPIQAEKWLDLLESHLQREESPRVWETLAWELKYLNNCDHKRATKFSSSVI